MKAHGWLWRLGRRLRGRKPFLTSDEMTAMTEAEFEAYINEIGFDEAIKAALAAQEKETHP